MCNKVFVISHSLGGAVWVRLHHHDVVLVYEMSATVRHWAAACVPVSTPGHYEPETGGILLL